MKNIKRVLVLSEVRSGHGGLENVTRFVINTLNEDPEFHSSLYFFHNGEKPTSNTWINNLKCHYSNKISKNQKLNCYFHIVKLALFIKKIRPDILIALGTRECHIAGWAIKMSCLNITLYSWMHSPPNLKYRPGYLTMAHRHLAISNEVATQLIALGARKSDIDLIYNFVKPSEITIGRPKKLKILYVGRILYEEEKRLKTLFEALRLLCIPWSLDVIGDGKDRVTCQKKATEWGIDNNITWHGWQEEPWVYIERQIDEISCLVLTSRFEGFGMVLVEAMSRGIYCISSDCGGPKDIIAEKVNGEFFATDDAKQLAMILASLPNRTDLPIAETIKASIRKFHEDRYIRRIKKSLA
ncbi:glycosyltransferase [Candidatus Pantoea multigeneris]|uniref:Glycosyltransferase n=1 Tax=Candidatus Pantoea multigeneris TaxID=2608357 RepID=A0ABX0R9K0_9GAMM|nr:glycosyltransferase [Pantoea multigeneris]NIF21017.1 glycosyltransferase [Pantoea multigeneris]